MPMYGFLRTLAARFDAIVACFARTPALRVPVPKRPRASRDCVLNPPRALPQAPRSRLAAILTSACSYATALAVYDIGHLFRQVFDGRVDEPSSSCWRMPIAIASCCGIACSHRASSLPLSNDPRLTSPVRTLPGIVVLLDVPCSRFGVLLTPGLLLRLVDFCLRRRHLHGLPGELAS